ncbi:MAG TPA: glycosyltransferase family 2 protein [Candidatus Nanopusillus sp.]|nr:glycosyltransferase family 2 protein [Candidatus Nanopusillus sp.]
MGAQIYYAAALYSYVKEKRSEKYTLESRPRWTAVVPVYNEEENIVDCLDSIINQTYPPSEIIILDDHSMDGTLRKVFNWLKEYKAQPMDYITIYNKRQTFGLGQRRAIVRFIVPKSDILVIYVRNLEKNVGKTMNLNWVAFNLVRTPYFANIDGDTILEKDYAEKVLPLLLEEDVAAAYGWPIPRRIRDTWQAKIIEYSKRVSYKINHFLFKQGQEKIGFVYNLMGCAIFYNTDIFRRIPRPHDSYAGDTSHAWELQAAGYKIKISIDGFVYTTEPSDMKKFWNQRMRWGAGPFQNLYLRGKKVLSSLKGKRKIAAFWNMFYYTILSTKYSLGILILPLLAFMGIIDQDIALKVYTYDFLMWAFAYSIGNYGYHKHKNNPLTFNELLKDTEEFLIMYFLVRYGWAFTNIVSAFHTLYDILSKKYKEKWIGMH